MTFYQNYLYIFFFCTSFFSSHICIYMEHIKIFFIQQNRNIHFSCSKKNEANVYSECKRESEICVICVDMWDECEVDRRVENTHFPSSNIYGYSCSIIYAK